MNQQELEEVCRAVNADRRRLDKRIADLEDEVKTVRETKREAIKAWNVAVDERDGALKALAEERALLDDKCREATIEALKGLTEIYEEAPVVGIALFDVRDRIEAEIARLKGEKDAIDTSGDLETKPENNV